MQGLTARYNKLRYDSLPKYGAVWRGKDAEFVEFVHKTIEIMPEPMSSVAKRHYVLGEGPKKDETTGAIVREDASYYNLVTQSVLVFATLIRQSQMMLEEING